MQLNNKRSTVEKVEIDSEYGGYSNNKSAAPEISPMDGEKSKNARSMKKNERSSSYDIAQEVSKTVEGENNETG